ncbi:MAG: methylenetetrahydrofolate reductase, partial [Lentisphaerota bacterium]
MVALTQAADKLLAAEPDFVTVTYGAGGSTREKTLQVCDLLRQMGYRVVMPHLTCVGSSQAELRSIVERMTQAGYRNIMTLRGDPPQGEAAFQPAPDGLSHASELVALIKQYFPSVCCGVASYPEIHPEAESAEADLLHLREKVTAGADFITTQLFFENKLYFDFVTRCRTVGIAVPILPGLLPAISLPQARRMASKCKTSLPPALEVELEKAGGTGDLAEEVGIRWAVRQIESLLENGAPGIHLYVLNRAKVALSPEISECM